MALQPLFIRGWKQLSAYRLMITTYMNDITININGGNNQILPNATEAVQNFYGDQFADKILSNTVVDKELCPEVGKLSLYVDKVS